MRDSSNISFDFNNDCVVNVIDVLMTVNCVLYEQCNDIYDITDDGLINIVDIIDVVNFILGNS